MSQEPNSSESVINNSVETTAEPTSAPLIPASAVGTSDGLPSISRRNLFKAAAGGVLATGLSSCAQVDTENVDETNWPVLPYIQNVSNSGAVVMWESPGEIKGRVEVFTNSDGNSNVGEFNGSTSDFHEIGITGLEPNTSYFYQAYEGRTRVGPMRSFQTFPVEGPDNPIRFSFIVVGDTGLGSQRQFQVADQMSRHTSPPAFLLHCGDVVYDGFVSEYPEKFFAPFASLVHRVPIFATRGDHDIVDGAEGFDRYFSLPTNNIENTDDYYSFVYSNALFICLNSNRMLVGDNFSQLAFLDQELARNFTWKFIFMGNVLHTAAKGRSASVAMRNDIGARAEENGVDVIFSGDVHAYERFLPRKDYFPERTGVGLVYINTGGGGADLRELNDSDQSVGVSTHHFCHITINGNIFTLRVTDFMGEQIDTYEIRK